MGLLSQLSALLILAAVTVAYLHATQPETVAPLLQRIRTWLLAKLEWDLATIMPELAPPPEPEPYAAPAFVDKRKGSKKATKKPPPKTQPAATNKKPHEGERDSADGVPVELRLDPSDGNYYPKESFVEVYGGTREWTLQEGTSRFSDATEPAAGDAAEGWTVVPSPSSKLAVRVGGAVGDSWWSDSDEEGDQWKAVEERAKRKRDQQERRKERVAAAAAAAPWAAAEAAAASGRGRDQQPNDGLTKKQRENKRRAEKKKAIKEAVDAARKTGLRG